MFNQLDNIFKRIFSNEETVIFSILIIFFLILFVLFSSVLTPFLVSIIFAYLLTGLQKKIESYGISTIISLIITYVLFLVFGAAIIIWLIPILYLQLESFFIEIPRLVNVISEFIISIPSRYPEYVSIDQISSFTSSLSSELSAFGQNIVSSVFTGIQSTITIFMYLILFPVLVYFFLFDRKKIVEGLVSLIPGKREMLTKVMSEMDIQLSNYVRGKFIEIIIVAIASAIIFSIVGLNFTALLSVLVGLSVIIPYIGAFLVTIPVVIIGFLQFGLSFDFYLLVILYLLLQALDGNVLVPIIFSDAVELHPVVIILAVFIFGSMFGFWGVFLAIPLAVFIKAVWNAWPSSVAK